MKTLLIITATLCGLWLIALSGNADDHIVVERKSSLDALVDFYTNREQTPTEAMSVSTQHSLEHEETLRLTSELIDLRVERDRLLSKNRKLEDKIEHLENESVPNTCKIRSCVPLDDAKLEKIKIEIAHSVHLFNLAFYMIELEEADGDLRFFIEDMKERAVENLRVFGFDSLDTSEELDLHTLLTDIEQREEARRQ